ncbi:vitellogenin [Procambarus clarkii]|uniref:vitellogenin n=1 Tax=Procambarus clarkii TaxID=6728 RepID=UPI003743585D
MTASTALLVFALVVGARAAPHGRDADICSRECPVAGAPKLFYQPGKTYTYEYSGKSKVQLKGVEGGQTERDWSAKVELSWITPCDMVISLKEAKGHSGHGPAAARFLERYPLVVAVADGRVQHVCSHHDDDAWSINMKKGVASIFQNSLPSNSTINSGQNITETDVVGKCPTKYEVQNQGDKVIVKKEKNHRLCKQRYPTPAETQVPWLKGPLPLEESRSVCKQEIRNGIYSSITCEDKNVVRPSYGAYKYIEAKQESTFRYISESNDESGAASAISQENMDRRSLRFDYDTFKKDPSMVAHLDQTMKQICEKTEDAVERDVGALVAKALHLMRRVPEDAIAQTLDKIRSGQFCQHYKKLEDIFLDSVAFVHEAGAVKVMVKELVGGDLKNGRAALYTAGLYLLPRPCIHAMMALKPLFESDHPLPMPTLAAASMVKTYCRHNDKCFELAPVRSLTEALGHKLQSQCSPSDDEETEKAALTTLKALGNMGIMTQEVARSVFRCMETEGVKNNIRVAAAQAFRQTKCHRQSTEQLVNFAVDPAKETEVRIASYLVAVRCAKQNDFEKIVAKISKEQNTQVRGFIFSHILNLQQSDAPEKANLRYLLENIVVPRNFDKDIRKYSRNIDVSYFSSSLGAGAGVESNIIYSPGSFVPRSIDFNLTAALAGISMNLGEVGARFEGFEPAIEEVFGPEGYLQKTNYGQLLNDVSQFVGEKGKNILEHWHKGSRERRSINPSILSSLFKKLYSDESRVTKADIFARFMGQEISFASLAGDLKDASVDKIGNYIAPYFHDFLIQIENLDINSARTAQMNFDYSFPTIQGTPLNLKMVGTAVIGLKMEGNLNLIEIGHDMRDGEKTLKIIPSLSIQLDGFVGYDAYLGKHGLKKNTTISTSNGLSLSVKTNSKNELEIQWDLPEKMEVINVKSETYLMMSERGRPETKVIPQSMRDTRIRTHSCINSLEPALGLKFCYELDIPDVFRSNSLPLGAPAIAKIYAEKEEPSMKGYRMTIGAQDKRGAKMLIVKVAISGSTRLKEAEATLSHTKEGDSSVLSARLKSNAATSGVWLNIINGHEHKGVQAHFKHKSDQNDISRGIKIDMTSRSTSSEKEYRFEVFSSRNRNFPPESQIFESRFEAKLDRPVIVVDMLSKTKNNLRNYLDWDLEIGADLRRSPHFSVPMLSTLRKFDFRAGMGGWKVSSIIKQTRESSENSAFSSAFKIARRSDELFSFEATHTTQGRLYHDFVAKTSAKIKLDRLEYKASCDAHCGQETKGVTLEIINSAGSEKIADIKAQYDHTGDSLSAKFEVDVPRYIKAIKFESKLAGHGQERYMLETALKHGDHVILQAQGPVTAKLSPMTEFQADIRFNTLNSGHHRFASTVKFSTNQQILSFELKDEHESMFAVEWDVKAEAPKKTSMIFKLKLMSLLEYEVDANMSERSVRVNFNSLLFAKSSSPRRVKGYTEIDVQQKKIQADLSLDADRDANKKIAFECSLSSSSSSPLRATIEGHFVWKSITFPFKLDVTATNILVHSRGENGFNLEIMTPVQRTIKLEAVNKMELQRNGFKSDTRVHYIDLLGKDYKVTNHMGLENLGDPCCFKVDYRLGYTSPRGLESSLALDAKHQKNQHGRIIYSKVSASTPSSRKPLQVEFQSSSEENSYNIHWKADLDSPATMFKWDMETHQEGGVKSFDSSIDMTAVRDVIKTVRRMVEGIKPINEHPVRGGKQSNEEKDYDSNTDENVDRPDKGHQGEDYENYPDEYSDRANFQSSEGRDYVNNMDERPSRQHYQRMRRQLNKKFRNEPEYRSSDFDYERNEPQDGTLKLRKVGNDYDNERNDYDNERNDQDKPSKDNDNTREHPGRESYRYRYENPSPDTYSLLYRSPFRSMEGEAEFSSSQSSLKFYPNRDQSEDKYQIATSSENNSDESSKFEGSFSRPGHRDMRFELQRSGSGESFRGSIELDMFPDTADKITGTLQSTLTAEHTVQIEASLRTRVLKVHPKVTVMAAYANHTTGFDVQFQESPSSPVTFQVSAIYDRVSPRDATMAFRVINAGVPVVDIAGTMQREEDAECNGHKVKAVAHISPLGTYDIHSKLCKPAFIQIKTKKHHTEMVFTTKLGYQAPNDIVASIAAGGDVHQENDVIWMKRVRLASPVRVKFETAYKQQEYTAWKETLKGDYQKIRSAVVSEGHRWYRYMKQQARQQGVPFPDPQILALIEEAKSDLNQIKYKVYANIIDRWHSYIYDVLSDPTVSDVLRFFSEMWHGAADFQKTLAGRLAQEVTAWQADFRGFTEFVRNAVAEIARMAETGELPDAVRRLLETTKIYKVLKSQLEATRQRFPEEYEAVMQVMAKVRATLKQDFEKVKAKLMHIPAVEKAVSWINHYSSEQFMRWEADKFISRLLQEVNFISTKSDAGYSSAEFHLPKPLYSLTQFIQQAFPSPTKMLKNLIWSFDTYIPAPVQDVIWAYYASMPPYRTGSLSQYAAYLLPPFNRTAMVVSDTEILTFDGAVLRAPRSPCEVVLAAYKSNKLTMAHPQPSAPPQINFSTRSAKVTIKPDFRVTINGQEMSRSRQSVGDVSIQKTSQKVKVKSPFMAVEIFRHERVVSVNVSGWTFGHIAGLMGSYDNEVGNDWFTSSGRNASSLKELVASWQEDQQCPTPDISPYDHSRTPAERIVECYSLLELRSRCYPLVHPGPFVKMCHAAHQPCDAAKAYRTICAWKGVKDMFPIAC